MPGNNYSSSFGDYGDVDDLPLTHGDETIGSKTIETNKDYIYDIYNHIVTEVMVPGK